MEAESSHFVKKRPFDNSATLRVDTVHAYGVDFMNTEEVVQIFAPYVKKIEWLDDSSCNVVCHDQESAQLVMDNCAVAEGERVWRSKRAKYTTRDNSKKEVTVEVRACTELDRKDSSLRKEDSKFYEWSRKEGEQMREKKRLKQEKKRMRKENHLLKKQQEKKDPVLSRDNPLLDPLLFMRVPKQSAPKQDFSDWLKEQEMASTPAVQALPSAMRMATEKKVGREKRPRDGSRPCAPERRPLLTLVCVSQYIKAKKVDCQVIPVKKSYRQLSTDYTKLHERKAGVDVVWDQYLERNRFTDQLVHPLYYKKRSNDGWDPLILMVPHTFRVQVSLVARALSVPVDHVRNCKLKDLVQDFGLPPLIAIPFGFEYSTSKKKSCVVNDENQQDADDTTTPVALKPAPQTLIDASLLECTKTLLFDVGQTAIRVSTQELIRCTGAICVDMCIPKAPTAEEIKDLREC